MTIKINLDPGLELKIWNCIARNSLPPSESHHQGPSDIYLITRFRELFGAEAVVKKTVTDLYPANSFFNDDISYYDISEIIFETEEEMTMFFLTITDKIEEINNIIGI